MKPDAYLDAVAALGCMVCIQPAQIHHAKGGSMRSRESVGTSQRTSDEVALPLCPNHHTGAEGIHTIGVLTWEARFGTQLEMLIAVAIRLEAAPRRPAAPKRRPVMSKILPRQRPTRA